MTWDPVHLEANLEAVLIDVEKQRSQSVRSDKLITKVCKFYGLY